MKAISEEDVPRQRAEFQRLWGSILQERADRSIIVGDAGDEETATLLRLEVDGGYCPRCGDLWKEVRFKNRFAEGRYFQPGCECYPRCPRCGNWQYEDFSAGVLKAHGWRCGDCGFKLLTDDSRRRYGSRYETAWGQMNRRERYVEAILGTSEQELYENRLSKNRSNCGPFDSGRRLRGLISWAADGGQNHISGGVG